jgi:N-acetylglucosaminyldiphosphoundecaprenol N-acetyl-beta-D-mannosaminyltransferase
MDRVPNDVSGATLVTDWRHVPGSGNEAASRRILGLEFFCGPAQEAVQRMRAGGLLVVPAAPALVALESNAAYREALCDADLVITDSSFMVLLWNLLEYDSVVRLSGLEYFDRLVADDDFRQEGAVLYIMASERSAQRNVEWLGLQGISVNRSHVYVAPQYTDGVADPVLLAKIRELRPRHVLITIGGGVQERLGLYIKQSLDYKPAIHCIGAAIAFRSGDQVFISPQADRLAMGWLLRCLWRPRSYVPRYWAARRLAWLLLRYRREMPPLAGETANPQTESSASVA